MNVFTHLAIAIRVKRSVEELLPVKLKTFDFLFGSIEPDISPSFDSIPHFKSQSEDFVKEEIENLLQMDYPVFMAYKDTFSERLGILTHYLSDFFCHAHSDSFSGNTLEHYLYEMRLSAYCHKHFREVRSRPYYRSLPASRTLSGIFGYIDELHSEYTAGMGKPSLSDDIAFAQEACFALCFSILTAYVAEKRAGEAVLEEAFI
jgi:hypothetical protein